MSDADPADRAAAACEQLRTDPDLGPVVDEHGPVVLEPAADPFRRLLVSIVRQQVSTAAADAITDRLFAAVDPTPEAVLAADEATLREAGLSAQKAGYVRNIATAFAEDGWSRERFAAMDDDRVVAELTAIKGIGEWTAEMQLMFTFGRPDVFPVGDLGIRKGMERVFGEEMTRSEMVDRAERWQPYRSYASLYLWRTVD